MVAFASGKGSLTKVWLTNTWETKVIKNVEHVLKKIIQ